MKKWTLLLTVFVFIILGTTQGFGQVVVRDSVEIKTDISSFIKPEEIECPQMIAVNETGEEIKVDGEVVSVSFNHHAGLARAMAKDAVTITSFELTVVWHFPCQDYSETYTIPLVIINIPQGSSVKYNIQAIEVPTEDLRFKSFYLSSTSIALYAYYWIDHPWVFLFECIIGNIHWYCWDAADIVTQTPTVEASIEKSGVYQISWPGMLQVELKVEAPYHYQVTLPDTVRYGEIATVKVKAKDKEGNDYFSIGPFEPLYFSLNENGQLYGNLLGPGGAKGKSLTGIPYYSAAIGKVKYVVDGAEPNGPKMVGVTVEDSYGASGSGGSVVVDLILFTIEIPSPKEVWPNLPPGSGGNPGDHHKKKNILVTLKKNLKPLGGQNITTRVRMILPSGGHYKTTQPPNNRFGQLKASTGESGIPSIIAQTQSNGTINIEYTAMHFGGNVEFTAKTTILGKELEEKDALTVRVPNLMLLPENPLHYTKVGGTCYHHGPSDMGIPASCQTPDDNHYSTAIVNGNIRFIAVEWQMQFPQEHTLFINDMSLPYGGLFDKDGNWQPPHNAHRIGTNADIRTELPLWREGVPVRTPRNVWWENTTLNYNRNFEKICKNYGATRIQIDYPNTDEEHYHVRF